MRSLGIAGSRVTKKTASLLEKPPFLRNWCDYTKMRTRPPKRDLQEHIAVTEQRFNISYPLVFDYEMPGRKAMIPAHHVKGLVPYSGALPGASTSTEHIISQCLRWSH